MDLHRHAFPRRRHLPRSRPGGGPHGRALRRGFPRGAGPPRRTRTAAAGPPALPALGGNRRVLHQDRRGQPRKFAGLRGLRRYLPPQHRIPGGRKPRRGPAHLCPPRRRRPPGRSDLAGRKGPRFAGRAQLPGGRRGEQHLLPDPQHQRRRQGRLALYQPRGALALRRQQARPVGTGIRPRRQPGDDAAFRAQRNGERDPAGRRGNWSGTAAVFPRTRRPLRPPPGRNLEPRRGERPERLVRFLPDHGAAAAGDRLVRRARSRGPLRRTTHPPRRGSLHQNLRTPAG